MNRLPKIVTDVARPPFLFVYWRLMNRLRGHKVQAWNVGRRARIGRKVIIRKGVEMGADVEIGDYSYISGPRTFVESTRIGKFCSIARQTVIGVGNHDHSLVTTHPFIISREFGGLVEKSVPSDQKPGPVIGNDVWIGINSIVMRGVTIGDGAVIAANSVVTRDVAPYVIAGGNPARPLRDRFPPETVEALMCIRWWDWSEEQLRERLPHFFDTPGFVAEFGASGSALSDTKAEA